VGALWKLLTSEEYQDYQIHVHHMHLLNKEERGAAEATAVETLIPLFQELTGKSVRFTENLIESRYLQRSFIFDMDQAAFIAANTVRGYKDITKVAMGRTKTDLEGDSSNFQARMQRAQKIFETVLSLESIETPERIFPVVELTKAEIYSMLPDRIRDASWSCRHPIYSDYEPPKPCNKCHTCMDLQAMREELQLS